MECFYYALIAVEYVIPPIRQLQRDIRSSKKGFGYFLLRELHFNSIHIVFGLPLFFAQKNVSLP